MVGAGAGVGAVDAEGAGPASLLLEDATLVAEVSSLVKYRKPPTPIAVSQTSVTATGHIQFGAVVAPALTGFFTCGVA